MRYLLKYLPLFFMFWSLLSASEVCCQSSMISGQIVTFKSVPLNGILVKSKKSKNEAITDSLGIFTIKVSGNDILKIKTKGFESVSMPTKGLEKINLVYMDNDWAYNQVVNNKNITKENLDYALKNYKDYNNNYDQFNDIFSLIQSVYPPAKIDDGGGNKAVYLNSRGGASVIADGGALLVVDGVITQNISGILPAKVSKINVLVGTETSLYGSRGAGGVIEITLKTD